MNPLPKWSNSVNPTVRVPTLSSKYHWLPLVGLRLVLANRGPVRFRLE